MFMLKDADTYDIHFGADSRRQPFPLLRHTADSDEFNTLRFCPPAALLEVEDWAFHHDSAVILPCLPAEDDGGEMPEGIDLNVMEEVKRYHPGAYEDFHYTKCDDDEEDDDPDWPRRMAVLLAVTYEFLNKNPTFSLLLVGHTDTSGTDPYNFTLSALRAENVHCLLTGNRHRWVEIAKNKSKVEDYQRICNHYADAYGWPCHVGEIDNDCGPRTEAGLTAFQATYNEVFDKSIAEDGRIGPETWGAIFDCYMDELARLMDVEVGDLAHYREQLRYVDDQHPWIGCGERLPIDQPRRNDYRSQKNRRVEILFFSEINPPDLEPHLPGGVMRTDKAERNDSPIYSRDAYTWAAILPAWWESDPPGSEYTPQFEILDIEDDAESRTDEPENEEYEVEVEELAVPEDDEDPFAPLDYYAAHVPEIAKRKS